MQNPTGFFFDLGIRCHRIYKPKNGMLSKFDVIHDNSNRTIDELDGDSCMATLLRARRAAGGRARLSVARLQSAGAGSGLETKSSALGAHLPMDTYS